jgi:DNA-binding CsgD family transcriptional regulator/predicted nuclease with RNAse H fold
MQRRGSREQVLMELMAALSSSLNLTVTLRNAYEVLSRLLSAEYAAICVSRPGQPTEYDWAVARLPQEFFARYAEIAPHDFVRRAVVARPNIVLRDSEMVSREELHRSALYEYCQALNMPLEHVMAVMLDMGLDWHGGFTLYREGKQKPFSDSEQAFLQRLTPVLASTVRNCRLLGEVTERGHLLDALFHHQGVESIVLAPPATEVMRTAHATELLQRWFTSAECGRHGLPAVLLERLAQLTGSRGWVTPVQDTWERHWPDRSLRVTFVPLPEQRGRRLWAMLLREVLHTVPVPQEWRAKITRREAQVVECVLQGWDNQLCAQHLGCTVYTLRTHLKRIYAKLRIASRSKLIAAARSHG